MTRVIVAVALLTVMAAQAVAHNIEAFFSIKCKARPQFKWRAILLEIDRFNDDELATISGESTGPMVLMQKIDAFDMVDDYYGLFTPLYQTFEFGMRIFHDCTPGGRVAEVNDKTYDNCAMFAPFHYTCSLAHTTYFIDEQGQWSKRKND